MKIQSTSSTSFNAKFFHSQSLLDVAKYAQETGRFEKLNTARKNIDNAYLNRRLMFELYETLDNIPFVIITRYTPKKMLSFLRVWTTM